MKNNEVAASQLDTKRPKIRMREDWERHIPSEEDGQKPPVGDFRSRPYVNRNSKPRAMAGGGSIGHRRRTPDPEAPFGIRSELESLYSAKSAELGTRSAPTACIAFSSQPSTERVQDPKTESHEFVHRSPHLINTACYDFFSRILGWILTLLGKILSLLQFPIAILITMLITHWGMQMVFASLPFAELNVCGYPLMSRLEFCKIVPSGTAHLPPEIKKGLDFTSKLEEMQALGAHSADLPLLLSMGEGGVRGMIVQLSVVDLPTRDKLMPLLHDYRDTVDRTIDGLSDWLSNIDQVVDHTILINSWAEAKLERIEARDSSLMTPLKNLANRVFGSTFGSLTTEDELRAEFFGLTEKAGTQVTKLVVQAQRHHGQLNELKAILDSIALAALGDRDLLRKEKLSQASYWRWILQSYRNKMSDFDAKMEICAHFYDHTEQALLVLSTTQIKINQMKSQLKAFRDGLNDAPLRLDPGKPASLRLYIDALKGGVKSLEATKEITRRVKAEKMSRMDETIRL